MTNELKSLHCCTKLCSTQSLLASGSGHNTVNIYNTEDFTLLKTLSDHTGGVTSVAFHPTQPLLASSSYDNTVKIYNTEDFTLLTTLSDHTSFVSSVAFRPTQPLLATGSLDNTVKIYKIIDAKRERRLRCLKEMCRGLQIGTECNDPVLCYLWQHQPPHRYARFENLKVGLYRKQILCFINFNQAGGLGTPPPAPGGLFGLAPVLFD